MRRPADHAPLRRWVAALLTVATGLTARADAPSAISIAGVEGLNGTEIYTHICQGCHMPAGQGAVGAGHYPKLAGDPALVSWQYAALTVLNGKDGMPPFGLSGPVLLETGAVHLSDEQIADVVNYVRSNFGNHYKDRATAKQVAALPHPVSSAP
jgi:mono/diheme cytochrome c family protein